MPRAEAKISALVPKAPYGYTKAGKPRKRPVPEKEVVCAVPECARSFKNCKNPKKARYKHYWYFTQLIATNCNHPQAASHSAELDKMRTATTAASSTATGPQTKRQKQNREAFRTWAQRHPEKAKKASAFSSLKYKAKRHLTKEGKELNEDVITQMAQNWMEEKFSGKEM